ncbi:MAG: IclR family transcriptional regulator [Pigmentiphaga sp.]
MKDNENQSQGIKSVVKAAKVLEVLRRADGPMRLIDLARACGMSRSLAHGYLASLLHTGLVTQDAHTGNYDLGQTALELGLVALTRANFLRLAREAMLDLNRHLGQTSMLAVWSENGPVVVGKIEGRRHSVFEVRVGSTPNLLLNATCHVFLAYLPRHAWEHLVPIAKNKDPRAQTVSEARIKEWIEDVRQKGICTHPTSLPNSAAMAAPVFDLDGDLKCVLTVVIPAEDQQSTDFKMALEYLRQTADQLTAKIGGKFADHGSPGGTPSFYPAG